MQDFKKLQVWNDAMDFALNIYKLTQNFPKYELYGLTSQLMRAATSISLNIAEGTGRHTDAAFKQFLHISMGSIKECETLIVLTKKLTYLNETEYLKLERQLEQTAKKLNNLISALN